MSIINYYFLEFMKLCTYKRSTNICIVFNSNQCTVYGYINVTVPTLLCNNYCVVHKSLCV